MALGSSVLAACVVLVTGSASRQAEAAFARKTLGRNSTEIPAAYARKYARTADGLDTLDELGAYFGTDKAPEGPHSSGFTSVYDHAFAHLRQHAKLVAEVGVFFGSSLKMWRGYFPGAQVVGVDHFTGIEGYKTPGRGGKSQRFELPRLFFDSWSAGEQGTRLHLIEAEEEDETGMAAAAVQLGAIARATSGAEAGYDLIVDDGSHKQKNQQRNLARLFPLLRPGGVFVIEDLHASLIQGYDEPPHSVGTTLAMLERWNATGGNTSSAFSSRGFGGGTACAHQSAPKCAPPPPMVVPK